MKRKKIIPKKATIEDSLMKSESEVEEMRDKVCAKAAEAEAVFSPEGLQWTAMLDALNWVLGDSDDDLLS